MKVQSTDMANELVGYLKSGIAINASLAASLENSRSLDT